MVEVDLQGKSLLREKGSMKMIVRMCLIYVHIDI